MNVEHQLYLRNSAGAHLTVLADGAWAGLSYGLKENEPGVLEFVLPGDFEKSLLMIDGQVEVRRAVGGGSLVLEGDTVFFIRRILFSTGQDGVTTIAVTAYSALSLLDRRVIPYFAGTSYTDKVDMPWDNLVREIIDENMGPGASDADRDLSPFFIIQADTSWGPNMTRSFASRQIMNVVQDIVADVRSQGIYCTFDVIRTAVSTFEFRVYLGPRGIDHSAGTTSPVIVSQERRNLLQPSLDYDWTDEKNFIYATGQGQKDERVVQTAQDNTRIGISPFGRNEFNRDARQAEIAASVLAEAQAALEELRPLRTFQGSISQTDGCIYGVHWTWGDIVTAEYQGISTDCHVTAISVSIDQSGTEIVTGALRSVDDV